MNSDLSNNELDGTIPSGLKIAGLDNLFLAGNQLCPIANYTSWARYTDYSYQPIITTCPGFCPAVIYDHATYTTTKAGTDGTGVCSFGYASPPSTHPTRMCSTQSVWGTIEHRCVGKTFESCLLSFSKL